MTKDQEDKLRMQELPCKTHDVQPRPDAYAQIQIGDFTLIQLVGGKKVWIRYKTGEGGEFSAEKLEAVIKQFFWEEF